MTLVSLPSPIQWPGIVGATGGGAFLTTVTTLTSAGHYVAYVFVAREDMVVSHVGARVGTVAGSPTLTATVETVDSTTGLPNGAGFGSSSGTTGTVSSSTYVLQALGASATIPKGSAFAVKFALASGTSVVVSGIGNLAVQVGSSLPYAVLNTGTPTKGDLSATAPMFALGSSSTTFYQVPGTLPLSAVSNGAFNNSTAGSKRGLLFTPPMNCRAIGLRWLAESAVGNYNGVLYNNAGSELSSSSTAFGGNVTAASGNRASTIYFDNAVTLTAGTPYRIAIEPTSTTNTNVSTYTLPSANYRSATPAGTTAQYTTFTTAGGWVDSATDTIPVMDVILDQIDDGAGSGGGGVIGVIGG
jgi:hypothetical protein